MAARIVKTQLPVISQELVETLSRLYPDVMPGPGESHDEIKVKIGQVSVVRFIKEQYRQQNSVTHVKG